VRERRTLPLPQPRKTVEARRSAAGAPRSEAGYLAAAAPRKPAESRPRIARHFSSGRCECQVSAQDGLKIARRWRHPERSEGSPASGQQNGEQRSLTPFRMTVAMTAVESAPI